MAIKNIFALSLITLLPFLGFGALPINTNQVVQNNTYSQSITTQDETLPSKKVKKKKKKFPILLGILTGVIIYYLGTIVLFGGTETASGIGLILFAALGGLFAGIHNTGINKHKNSERVEKKKSLEEDHNKE